MSNIKCHTFYGLGNNVGASTIAVMYASYLKNKYGLSKENIMLSFEEKDKYEQLKDVDALKNNFTLKLIDKDTSFSSECRHIIFVLEKINKDIFKISKESNFIILNTEEINSEKYNEFILNQDESIKFKVVFNNFLTKNKKHWNLFNSEDFNGADKYFIKRRKTFNNVLNGLDLFEDYEISKANKSINELFLIFE